jgi:YD repeat-containing protein
MKKLTITNGFYAILFAGSQLLFSCREREKTKPAPAPDSEVPAVKLSQAVHSGGSSRTFFYQAGGQLREIGGKGMYALSGHAESRSTVLYDAAGKLKEITTQGESSTDKTVYSYNAAGQLVRTEEYTDSQLQYYFTYEYNAQGQLIIKYSFAPQTPESTVFGAGLKREYEYDPRSNLSRVTASWKAAGTGNWGVFLTHQYLAYDNGHSVDHWLDSPHYLPGVVLQHNNPGQEVRVNHPGGETTVTTHTYAYNSKNYPVKRITASSNNTSSHITFSYTE